MSTDHTEALRRSYSHARTTGPRGVRTTPTQAGDSENALCPIFPGDQLNSIPPEVHAFNTAMFAGWCAGLSNTQFRLRVLSYTDHMRAFH